MPSSLDDYEVLSTIGTGSYGTCKKIRRKKDGKVLVWKELEYGVMSETEKQMLVAEVNLLRELKHRHIVRYYDRIIDRTSFKLYIIMEYCEGGDLAQRINKAKKEGLPVDEEFAWRICTQVVSALSACHSITETSQKKILHRDLKPANVFLDSEDNVKLGDFGLARVLNHDTSFAKTFVGTPYYMSPEQMNYLSYNEKSDIWSLGCLLYELCALRPPFTAANQRELATRICDGRFTRIPMRYSDELNDIVKYMLQVDEFKRPSIHDVSQHPLVLKYTSRLDTGRLLKDRRSSTGSDEGYNSRLIDSLKKREELLAEKERELLKKETDLKVRENNIARREKQAEDRMNRAEKLLTDYAEMKIIRTAAPRPGRRSLEDSDDDFSVSDTDAEYDERPKSSCLARKKPMDSPKKQVSFCMDKENDLYSMGLPDDNAQEKPTSGPSVETKTREKRRSSAGSKTAAKLDKGYSRGREPSTGKYSAKAATTLGKDLYKPDTDLNRDLYKIGSDFTTKGITSDYTRISSEFDKLSPRDHLLTETRLQQAHTKHMSDLRDRLRRAEIRSSELRLGDYQSKYSPVYTQQTLGIR